MENIKISIAIPCYNEQANVNELINRIVKTMANLAVDYEIIMVNDASTDNTKNIISQHPNKNIILLHNETNMGLAFTLKRAINHARGEYICIMDADLQNQPEDIYRLYKAIETFNVDIVQGARSPISPLKESRNFYSKGLNILLQWVFGLKLRDVKSSFLIARNAVLKDLTRTRNNYKYWQIFPMIIAQKRQYTFRDIETIFLDRMVGKNFVTNTPIAIMFIILYDIIKAFFEFQLQGDYDNSIAQFVAGKPLKNETRFGWLRDKYFKFYAYTMPLHGWLIGRNIYRYFHDLNRSQWLSRDNMIELQNLKLQQMISHCYNHVTYYRELFDRHNLKPSDIQTYKDLVKIPLLDKKIIRENLYHGMLSDNYNKNELLLISTSGSTGVPFQCYADKFQLEMRWATTLRGQTWTGYQFGDRCARLWHQTIGMNIIQIIKEFIDAFLTRRIFIPAYELSDKNLNKYMRKLFQYKPVLIDGYAESFNFLAQYVEKNKIQPFTPKGIISSAQTLPKQSRDIIEQKFNTKVYDKYGSREFSGIAYQSSAQYGHLVNSESYIVEILKDGMPAPAGELGEVVITDLNNKVMPFIRYRVGDLAVAHPFTEQSPCGRGMQIIGDIEGRVQAIIFAKNGNFVPGTFFAHFFKEHSHLIKQYQVIQNILDAVDLKIIKGERFNDEQFNQLIDELRQFLGHDMHINILFVDEIQMGRTGKRQGAISNISFDFQKLTAR